MAVRVRLAAAGGSAVAVQLDFAADGPGGGHWWDMAVAYTPVQGRHVLATRGLAAGEVVCAAPVHALSVLEEWKKRVCAYCFAVAPGRLSCSCSDCEQAFYCGAACRAAHREHGGIGSVAHALVCPALRRFPALKKLGKDNVAMLRLMLEVLAARHSRHDNGQRGTEASDGFEELVHHPPDYGSPKEAAVWAKASHLLREAISCCEWCPWGREEEGGTSAPPTDAELHAVLSRLDSNCFGCYRCDGGPTIGHGCFLSAAVFNHSCDPNCFATSGASTLHIETQQAVARGEELTIAYVDTNLPRSARQKHLRACYHFDCACTRCVLEASASAPKQKLSYQKAARGTKRREENAKPPSAPLDPAQSPVAGSRVGTDAAQGSSAKPKAKAKAPNVPWFEALA